MVCVVCVSCCIRVSAWCVVCDGTAVFAAVVKQEPPLARPLLPLPLPAPAPLPAPLLLPAAAAAVAHADPQTHRPTDTQTRRHAQRHAETHNARHAVYFNRHQTLREFSTTRELQRHAETHRHTDTQAHRHTQLGHSPCSASTVSWSYAHAPRRRWRDWESCQHGPPWRCGPLSRGRRVSVQAVQASGVAFQCRFQVRSSKARAQGY